MSADEKVFNTFSNLANLRITGTTVRDMGDFLQKMGTIYTQANDEDREKIADVIQHTYNAMGRIGMMVCMEAKTLGDKMDNLDCPSMKKQDQYLSKHPFVQFLNNNFDK